MPLRAAPLAKASVHTNRAQQAGSDQAPSSDSFANDGASSRRSSGASAAGGADNGNAAELMSDNDHHGDGDGDGDANDTSTTTRATAKNAAGGARKPAGSPQGIPNVSFPPRVHRLRNNGAAAASSNPPKETPTPKTTSPRAQGATAARGVSSRTDAPHAAARKSTSKRSAPAAAATSGAEPSKKCRKASQAVQPELKQLEVGQLVYAEWHTNKTWYGGFVEGVKCYKNGRTTYAVRFSKKKKDVSKGLDRMAIALPEELKGEHRARFEKELEKYKQDFAPEDIAEIERYQSRQANRRPQAPPVPPQGASLEAPVTPAPSQASTGEASSPASTELDHDANFAPHKEDEASDGPPAHHRAEHRSTETQDVMPNEKIPCAHYISHQGEEEHDPARKIKKFVVDILEKTEAKAFLKKRANDRSDASCREIAAHRIEVKFEHDNCAAFVALLKEFGQAWLDEHRVRADDVATQLRDHMDDHVLKKDLSMQKLIKKNGGYEGRVYSLLVSYGEVEAQPIHIDCVYPEYMGAMLLTPGPKTVICPVHEELGIELGEMTCQDLAELICARMGRSSLKHEAELTKALESIKDVRDFIKNFGYVLSSAKVRATAASQLLEAHPGLADKETGYVGMMGSVCHGGPKSKRDRHVAFASYKPTYLEGYNGDEQHNSATFLAVIISYLVEGKEEKEENEVILTRGCMEMLLNLLLVVAKEPFQGSFLNQVELCDEAACLLKMVTESEMNPNQVAEAYEWVVAKRNKEGRSLKPTSKAARTYEALLKKRMNEAKADGA